MIEANDKSIERYRRLIEISRDLASTLDLDPLLYRIIEAGRDVAEAENASILLYDEAARQLYFQVATNMDQPLMRGFVVPMDSIAGWIVTNRKAVRIADPRKDSRWFKNISQTLSFETNSIMGIPLITKDKVIGVLEAINKKGGEFSDTDEDLLSVLGAQAAIAIENTRLFQQSDLIAEFVHELRTPLSSLSTATYLLTRPEISHDQSTQIINNIHNETMRLNVLATSFLDLARLESGRVQFTQSSFPFKPLVDDCKSVMQSKADESRITIELQIPTQPQGDFVGFGPVDETTRAPAAAGRGWAGRFVFRQVGREGRKAHFIPAVRGGEIEFRFAGAFPSRKSRRLSMEE